jgi:hypothetical protein
MCVVNARQVKEQPFLPKMQEEKKSRPKPTTSVMPKAHTRFFFVDLFIFIF